MQPKKKGMETPIVYGIFLILVLFIALHGAVAYKIAQSMVAVGELEKTKTTLTVINLLCDRIATPNGNHHQRVHKAMAVVGRFWVVDSCSHVREQP